MKSIEETNRIMQKIPLEWRNRWCGGENGACACLGCVQIGNRAVMAEELTGQSYSGDPEYINEGKIPKEIREKLKITKEEWLAWKSQKL
jgi:hypothetical protein